jgi:DHA2 family multidrug resistance protein
MTRFISVREQFHSNLLGLDVQTGSWLTDMRLRMLGGALLPESQNHRKHNIARSLF